MNKAFFLDRDGTIIVDKCYLGDPQGVELLPGAAEAIKKMNDAGFLVIVVTNQSGVARGFYPEDNVKRVNARLNEQLSGYGAHIDAFYYCPHLPGAPVKKYDVICDCRKPKLGLFKKAIDDFNLNPELCFACGDKARDVAGLEKLGIPVPHQCIVYNFEYGNIDLNKAFIALTEDKQ